MPISVMPRLDSVLLHAQGDPCEEAQKEDVAPLGEGRQ